MDKDYFKIMKIINGKDKALTKTFEEYESKYMSLVGLFKLRSNVDNKKLFDSMQSVLGLFPPQEQNMLCQLSINEKMMVDIPIGNMNFFLKLLELHPSEDITNLRQNMKILGNILDEKAPFFKKPEESTPLNKAKPTFKTPSDATSSTEKPSSTTQPKPADKTPSEPINSTKKPKNTIPLSDEYELQTFKTLGEGSCAIHAILGEFDKQSQMYICPNIAAKRVEFGDKLDSLYKEKKLPERISLLLHDYLIHSDTAPSGFSKNEDVVEARKTLSKILDEIISLNKKKNTDSEKSTLTESESSRLKDLYAQRDQHLNKIIHNNADVFKAYLNTVKDTGQYLTQEEVQVFSELYDKKLVLFQKEQDGSGKVGFAHLTGDSAFQLDLNNIMKSNTSCVWFNGVNHYEKATLFMKKQSN